MEEHVLRNALKGFKLGGVKNFSKIGSTNDIALAWAADGALDLSLVLAEEQSAGRGRGIHRWYTLLGTGLAFSLILRPIQDEKQSIPLFSALGAMAVCDALEAFGLHPEIKWPNDVLLVGKKTCGVMAESIWMGGEVDCIVLGIGINVKPEGLPPSNLLDFPATSIESEMGLEVNRPDLLRDVLNAVLKWRNLITMNCFIREWENRLAFRDVELKITSEGWPIRKGIIEGLENNGNLRLRTQKGERLILPFGEVHLQPVL